MTADDDTPYRVLTRVLDEIGSTRFKDIALASVAEVNKRFGFTLLHQVGGRIEPAPPCAGGMSSGVNR